MSDKPGDIAPEWRALRSAILAVVLGVFLLFILASAFPSAGPGCVWRAQGGHCSSCGLTRSVRLAMGGKFVEASRYHPAGIPISTLVVLASLARPVPYLFPSRRLIAADGLIFVCAWAAICVWFFPVP